MNGGTPGAELFPGELGNGAVGSSPFDQGWTPPPLPEAVRPHPPPPPLPELVPAAPAPTVEAAYTADGEPERPRPARRLSPHLSAAGWLTLLAAFAVAFFLVWRGGVGRRLTELGRGGPPATLSAVGVRGGSYDTVSGQPVLVVRGELLARSAVKGPVRVKVDLVRDDLVVATASALAGATVSPEQVHAAGSPAAVTALGRARDNRALAHLEPGTDVPFVVVFPPPAPEPRGLELRVSAEPVPPEVKPKAPAASK